MKNYLKSVLAMIATFCIFTALSGVSYANTAEGIFVMPTTQNCEDEKEEQKENSDTIQNCEEEEDENKK
jgi:hypothetical protein